MNSTDNMNLEKEHRGQGFSRPISEVKKAIEKRSGLAGFLDFDPMRTRFKPDIEKKFLFKEDSLKWVYFMYDTYTDKMDLTADGIIKSLWDGTSENLRSGIKPKECYLVDLKASKYPDLIKNAKKFLKSKGYDVYDKTEVKVLEGIRFLVEFEDQEGEPGKVLAQVFYIDANDEAIRTPFIEGEF